VGDEPIPFIGLRWAGQELDRLESLLPDITTFRDQDFSRKNIEDELGSHQVLHLATHATFLPGDVERSFILFGDGDQVTLRDIGNWSLHAINLVVLSACETALGDVLGDGAEILGLGYTFQQRGAQATVASLWKVESVSTHDLMVAFYAALQRGVSKADALREAQKSLLRSQEYGHPYFWAPFILIGNGM
jgi:CHAT domain-containing protein